MAFNLRNRSFLKEIDFTPQEMRYLLQLSEALKIAKYAGTEGKRLAGKEIALIFEKTSTRTRSAFEVAANPIRGRLARSRSPPHPRTTISRPAASWRAARSTFSTLSGVCA